jgi:hypothetical protein
MNIPITYCYGLNMFPKFICWKSPVKQCFDVGPNGGVLVVSVLILLFREWVCYKINFNLFLPFSLLHACTFLLFHLLPQDDVASRSLPDVAPQPWNSQPPKIRQVHHLYKLSNLWYFVIAAQSGLRYFQNFLVPYCNLSLLSLPTPLSPPITHLFSVTMN